MQTAYLALRLWGPMQSWGFSSEYPYRRTTGLWPTKSAIAGICCASGGYPKGSDREGAFLVEFNRLRMTTIRTAGCSRLVDFHTVQGVPTADGKTPRTIITHREYLTDAKFGVVLEGPEALLEGIAGSVQDPVWGIWLGRRCCIPSAPLLISSSDGPLFKSFEAACAAIILDCGGSGDLNDFDHQVELDTFEEGRDSIPDQAVCFGLGQRKYSSRRVKVVQRRAG